MTAHPKPTPTALNFQCDNCQAPAGEPCTQPTDTGRRNVTWFHSARENVANGWSVGGTVAPFGLARGKEDY